MGIHDRARARDGNVAIAFALVVPLLLGAAGAGVDASRFISAKSALQEAADAAALSGARQLFLKSDTQSAPEEVARHTATTALARHAQFIDVAIEADASSQLSRVDVAITARLKATLLTGFFVDGFALTATASAEARGSGGGTCVIGLEPAARNALSLNASAKITAPGCAIYANSTSNTGLAAMQNAKIKSALTCSAGGYSGGSMNFDPMPVTDCPPRENPMAGRAEPSVGACTYNRKQVDDFTGALDPGVYCGGLVINGASDVTLNPGIYVFKDGAFEVLRTSKVTGEKVGLFFTGKNANIFFQENADISLSGPVSGPMAGVLIWQQSDASANKVFEVRSTNVHTLTGTIYLPKSTFYASVDAPVAQSSAYTAIIANKIALDGQVNLVLNDDYGATDVPVPGAASSFGGEVFLRD